MQLTHCLTALFLVLPASTANCASSQNSLGVPVLGLAYDSTFRAIRPILGIPGAAILGEVIDFGFPIAAAAISPRNNMALAVSSEDEAIRILQFQAGIATELTLGGAMTAPSRMVFSPSGSAALLYQQASRKLQVVTGLPGSPFIQDVSLNGVADSARAAAISDDGQLILLNSSGRSAGPVWLLPVNGSPQLLPFPGSLVSFRPNSRDALTTTPAGDVYLVNDVVSSAYQKIYPGDSSTANPVAISFSSDGSLGYLASSSGILTVFNLTSGASSATSCGCVPAFLQPLNSSHLFRISEISGTPITLFDGSAESPRIWFIPARPATPARRGGGQ